MPLCPLDPGSHPVHCRGDGTRARVLCPLGGPKKSYDFGTRKKGEVFKKYDVIKLPWQGATQRNRLDFLETFLVPKIVPPLPQSMPPSPSGVSAQASQMVSVKLEGALYLRLEIEGLPQGAPEHSFHSIPCNIIVSKKRPAPASDAEPNPKRVAGASGAKPSPQPVPVVVNLEVDGQPREPTVEEATPGLSSQADRESALNDRDLRHALSAAGASDLFSYLGLHPACASEDPPASHAEDAR